MRNFVGTVIGIAIAVVIAVALVFALGCDKEGQDRNDAKTANAQQANYAKAQPVPKFDWSLERDLVIQLYQARNREIATHTVWRSDYGLVEGDCESIGFGIPYDTSLTNPLKKVYDVAIEQAEPNGIFASKNSAATWVMCVVQEGDKVSTVPVYIESKVTVFPYPVIVDYDANRVKRGEGGPSIAITTNQ